MATMEILVYPHPHLKTITQNVTSFDESLLRDYQNMVETMRAHNGAGLAANQVGLNHRLFIADPSSNEAEPICFANVEILNTEGEELKSEGCLSFPGIYVQVKRALRVHVRAHDQNGQPFEAWYDGLMAHIIQHETDHLNGIVFLDHFSPLKREMLEKKYKKVNRMTL